MEKKKINQTSTLNFCTLYQGRKKCKGMREGRRCHSRWLKDKKRIDLRVNREISNEAAKNVKKKYCDLRNPGDRPKLRSPL